MKPGYHLAGLALTVVFAACSTESAAHRTQSSSTPTIADTHCNDDADCVFNPIDCSECGRCPDSEPTAILATRIPMLREDAH